jgi:hypothetical protein
MTMRLAGAIVALLAGSIFSEGCATTMVIETEPVGAHVSIDGKPVGDAPAVTKQLTVAGGRLRVAVDAPGYETSYVTVTQSELFLWPAIIAVTPLLMVPVIVVPVFGPIITIGWAIVTSPTLLSLLFIQKYPDRVKVTLKPRLPLGIVAPTDAWTIPDDAVPNPPPLPKEQPPAPDAPVIPQQPAQPEGGNPVP